MKYAHKIDLSDDLKSAISIGAKVATYGGMFDLYKTVNREKILSYFPEAIKNKKIRFYVVNIDFNKGPQKIKVHKHLKEKCVLNIYLQTNGEETTFYEGEEVYLAPEEEDESSGSTRMFQNLVLGKLHKVESFVAKTNESWLLKTGQPHSVTYSKKTGVRKMLQIYFLEDEYDEIVELFEVNYDSN